VGVFDGLEVCHGWGKTRHAYAVLLRKYLWKRHLGKLEKDVGRWHYCVRFKVLSAENMKIVVFWDVMPCSLVDCYNISEQLAASFLQDRR
jgi:hypothetical protein